MRHRPLPAQPALRPQHRAMVSWPDLAEAYRDECSAPGVLRFMAEAVATSARILDGWMCRTRIRRRSMWAGCSRDRWPRSRWVPSIAGCIFSCAAHSQSATRMGNPSAGRSVTSSSGRTGASEAWRSRTAGTSTARAASISVMAKWVPMQLRGPPPKGK